MSSEEMQVSGQESSTPSMYFNHSGEVFVMVQAILPSSLLQTTLG